MDLDDGDLMSVVMSCGQAKMPSTTTPASNDPSLPSPPLLNNNIVPPVVSSPLFPLSTAFPAGAFGGLEDLCVSFFPHRHLQQQQKPWFGSSDLTSAALSVEPTLRIIDVPLLPQKQPSTVRSKKKKNQQPKKVITQVPAERIMSNDNWAWRKYGQKPIKGSPYPRGYYRCSTRKECPARKQVEQSWTNPGMYIITYSGDHNHALPAHRNSLSGTTRNRFPSSSSSPPPFSNAKPSGVHVGLSPTTPLTTTLSPVEEEEDEEDDGNMLHVEDMEIAGDDELLFLGAGADDSSLFDVDDGVDPFFCQLWNNDVSETTKKI